MTIILSTRSFKISVKLVIYYLGMQNLMTISAYLDFHRIVYNCNILQFTSLTYFLKDDEANLTIVESQDAFFRGFQKNFDRTIENKRSNRGVGVRKRAEGLDYFSLRSSNLY